MFIQLRHALFLSSAILLLAGCDVTDSSSGQAATQPPQPSSHPLQPQAQTLFLEKIEQEKQKSTMYEEGTREAEQAWTDYLAFEKSLEKDIPIDGWVCRYYHFSPIKRKEEDEKIAEGRTDKYRIKNCFSINNTSPYLADQYASPLIGDQYDLRLRPGSPDMPEDIYTNDILRFSGVIKHVQISHKNEFTIEVSSLELIKN